jgi:adenylate cyclase
MSRLLAELRRRRVFRVAGGYAVVAWLVMQIAETTFPYLGLPAWTVTLVIVIMALGFPVALVLGWAYDITPEGVVRTEPAPGARPAGRGRWAVGGGVAALLLMTAVAFSPWGPGTGSEGPGSGLAGPAAAREGGHDGALPPRERTVAVLPLDGIGDDAENLYFSEGITEDIIAHLSRISDLRVISRTSVLQYRERTGSLRDIGDALGAGMILEGSVRRSANRVKLVVRLVDAESDRQVWAETFERELRDVFVIQADIAQQVAALVSATLTTAERQRLATLPTTSPQAYDLYLQGRHFWDLGGPQNARRALELFEQATSLDPGFAHAWAGKSDAWTELMLPPHEAYAQAIPAAERALQLAPDLGEALNARGWARFAYQLDWAGAGEDFRRAVTLNPSYAQARSDYAMYLMAMRRFEEAIVQARRGTEVDPLNPHRWMTLAEVLTFANRPGEALAAADRGLELAPWHPRVLEIRGNVHRRQGRLAEAMADYERAMQVTSGQMGILGTIAILSATGRGDEARAMAERAMSLATERYVPAGMLAYARAASGDIAAAIPLWERAAEDRDVGLVILGLTLEQDPALAPLRGDPRMTALIGRIGLP